MDEFVNKILEQIKTTIRETIIEVLNQGQITNEPENDDELISIIDAANLLKVSVPTIHNWKRVGIIPSYKKGRKVYFKRSEVISSLNKVYTSQYN